MIFWRETYPIFQDSKLIHKILRFSDFILLLSLVGMMCGVIKYSIFLLWPGSATCCSQLLIHSFILAQKHMSRFVKIPCSLISNYYIFILFACKNPGQPIISRYLFSENMSVPKSIFWVCSGDERHTSS